MAAPALRDKERNAARSREQILDAAERLFADRGYEETSLSDVGQAAGVSRATPGYYFGSKAELYRAVLERCFEEVRAAVRQGRERARRSGQGAEVVLAGAVSDYVDFIAQRPNVVRLVERAALAGDTALDGLPLGLVAGKEMVAALGHELELDQSDPAEASHLLLSLIALTWFPEIHGRTLVPVTGLDTGAPGFLEARKRHVTELLLGWLRTRRAVATRSPPPSHRPASRTAP